MATSDRIQTGVILLTPRSESEASVAAAEAYWRNRTGPSGELEFPVLIKEIVEDDKLRSNTGLTADYFAAIGTAELTGLPCRRCNRTLNPVQVHSRKDARALWNDQRLPNRSQALTCGPCEDEVSSWLAARVKDLPEVLDLRELLSAQALLSSKVCAARMKGSDLAAAVGFDVLNRLALSVLVPVTADHWDAIVPGGRDADFFPARLTWEFAGREGTAAARKSGFEALVASQMLSPAIFAEDLVAAARTCIENEVLNYLSYNIQERKWTALDEAQVDRVRATVASDWGPLNLGMLYNVVWSAFRAAADLTSYRTKMGNQSRSGYIVNQISRGVEKIISGEWDRREYDQPAKLPYRPESLALFRTLLDLDIRTATPNDVDALRVPAPVPDGAAILRQFRGIVTSRQDEVSQEPRAILESFLAVYSTHLTALDEPDAFKAALTGFSYLEDYVNPSTLESLQFELEEMRGIATIRAERELLARGSR